MPTVNNATVATGTGLSTAGNGGRKLVRLLNGALVSAVRTSTTSWQLHKSLNGGTTWAQLVTVTEAVNDLTLAAKGNDIHVTVSFSTSGVKHYRYNDSGVLQGTAQNVDSGQTTMGAVSTAINDAGTELHAAWSSKNSAYPNSFNIRYAKGTIAADGSVTWGAVEQVTIANVGGYEFFNPSIAMYGSEARIFANTGFYVPVENGSSATQSNCAILVFKKGSGFATNSSYVSSAFTFKHVYSSAYARSNPIGLFVPQSINGLANGRLWNAWHNKDATDSSKFNIYTSFSDDGGATWSTPVKQTSGNLYDQTNASLTADSQGKVLLTWDSQNGTTTQTALKVFNGTWGATTTLTGDGYTNATTLFDNTFKLSMTTPPLIRQSSSGVYFSGAYFTGASVAPASSALGNKETPSVLSYTVTPESGSTITSIVEKVNGVTVNTYSNPASLSRTFTIPPANWDALKYYNTHTISVTVTDSNGMANTQTYTFNKALANDASLLEGTKAAKDGKDRISTKRDGIAGQVGLPPGSTFDAISAQLASGNVLKKFATGTTTTDSNFKISVAGLSFTPKYMFWIESLSGRAGFYNADDGETNYLAWAATRNNNFSLIDSKTGVVTISGFTVIAAANSGRPVTWWAFG
ncbi:hypothetical protein ACWS7L_07985 [Exiguobacterium artemiae]